ncbi:MAG TPA: hypothetical protein VNE63_16655, partial [Candidatus Acidoferrales bacterium]|nr:hypothetical protein [Candidatus Acidoferrales bacterium]
CASVSNSPDRAIGPPSALLTLLISHFQKLNQHHFNGLSTVVQQLLVIYSIISFSNTTPSFQNLSQVVQQLLDRLGQ